MREHQRSTKSERLESRCTKHQKDLITQAAALSGESVTDFTMHILMDAANKIIQENQVIRLCVEDQRAYINGILNPPEPSERLIAAKKRYDDMVDPIDE